MESPLQLLAAAEFAEAQGRAIDVAFRLSGPQMPATAQVLLDSGALFSSCTPYFGIPWKQLAERRSWVIGDGLSGQFHLAMSTIGARSVTFLDDGIMTIHLARALAGAAPFARPGQAVSRRRAMLASLTRERLHAASARESLGLFTAFGDHPAIRELASHGVALADNGFGWLRSHGRPITLPSRRIVLGAAVVADRTRDAEGYLDWVRSVARSGADTSGADTTGADATGASVAYLPHRREPEAVLARIAELPGVTLIRTGLPVELALAGTTEPLDIVSLRSTAAVTLRIVLAGTGSAIRTSEYAESVR